MRKKVLVNGSFVGKPMAGVPRAALLLTEALMQQDELEVQLAVRPGCGHRPELGPVANDVIEAPSWAQNSQLFEQVALPVLLRRGRSELLLSLSNVVVASAKGRSQVAAFYDAAPLRHPEAFSFAYRQKFRASVGLAKAKRVQTVTFSQFAASDLSSTIGLSPFVLPLGRGLPRQVHHQSRDGDTPAYCIAHGASDGRKRVSRLIKAWAPVHESLGLRLVVLNPASITHRPVGLPTMNCETDHGVTVVSERLTDPEFAALISGASAFVTASEYEGAALAADEALALGTPVVASDIAVYRELLTGRVTFFSDWSDLVSAVRTAVASERPVPSTAGQIEESWLHAGRALSTVLLKLGASPRE